MANFDNFKEKAYCAAGATADAAKHLALIAKYRLAILAEQEKIRSLCTKLGKVYYKDYVTDEEPDEAEYTPLCERISDCYRRINELRAKLEDLRNSAKQEAEEEAAEEEEILQALAEAPQEATE